MSPDLQNEPCTALVVGADGLIGQSLYAAMKHSGIKVLGTTRRTNSLNPALIKLDLSGRASSWKLPSKVSTAYICAGIASIEQCEQNPEASRTVNCKGTIALAQELARRGAKVIYLSSNQVFDGSSPRRNEHDEVCPLTEYGRQKAETEQAILQLGSQGAILRLTKVLSPGNELLEDWKNKLKVGETVLPYEDMRMAPISVELVVDTLRLLTMAMQQDKKSASPSSCRIVQLSACSDMTYEQVARHIARHIGADRSLICPVSARSAGLEPASTPLHTTLSTKVLTDLTGLQAPDPCETVRRTIGVI